VLDVAVTPDSATGEDVTHYLVLWRSLPYEDSTWELEQDVDQYKVDIFNRYRQLPPKEERQVTFVVNTVHRSVFYKICLE